MSCYCRSCRRRRRSCCSSSFSDCRVYYLHIRNKNNLFTYYPPFLRFAQQNATLLFFGTLNNGFLPLPRTPQLHHTAPKHSTPHRYVHKCLGTFLFACFCHCEPLFRLLFLRLLFFFFAIDVRYFLCFATDILLFHHTLLIPESFRSGTPAITWLVDKFLQTIQLQ